MYKRSSAGAIVINDDEKLRVHTQERNKARDTRQTKEKMLELERRIERLERLNGINV